MVDDALGVVGEVTELSFPHGQRIGGDERITELEAESTELGKVGVGNDELGLVVAKVVERDVLFFRLLVVENSVTLRECTTLDVLSGNTDMHALEDKRTEGESLSGGPIDVGTLLHSLSTGVQDTSKVAVDVETLRVAGDRLADLMKDVL